MATEVSTATTTPLLSNKDTMEENPFMSFIMPLVNAAMEEQNDNRLSKRKFENVTTKPPKTEEEEEDDEFNEKEDEENQEEEEEDEYYDGSDNGAKRLKSEGKDSKSKKSSSKKEPKKRRVKSIAQSRSIFKKAVLKVFLDQRKKGVKILSLNKVWTLIREAGLIKTMGKTPIQSVSCALSQDVLRGSESSFVRVGKGLYSLKDNITEAQLAEYLEMDGNYLDEPTEKRIRSKKGSDVSSEEESEGPASPVAAPPSLPANLPSPSRALAPQATGSEKGARWIGEPVYISNKKAYFGAVQIDKHIFRLGACAYIESTDRPFLGRITSLYQESDSMYVECLWYCFPEDTPLRNSVNKNEVFLTKNRETHPVDSLLSSNVEVTSFADYKERQKKGKVTDELFYCQQFYSWETESCEQIQLNENIYMVAANLDKLQSKATVNMLLTELQLHQIGLQGVTQSSDSEHGSPLSRREDESELSSPTASGSPISSEGIAAPVRSTKPTRRTF